VSNTTSEPLWISGIVNDSITDGPGLRLVLFMQGCTRGCPGCHNPQALPSHGGTRCTPEEILKKIRENPLLSGVTFSGGEPLLQANALVPLAEMIQKEGLPIAIYTGYTLEELLAQADPHVMALLSLSDTLIDGPFLENRKSLTLPFRGSENQRILSLPQSLKHKKPVDETGAGWGASGI
jgi:anaerobic ribonucleoside-triphosphate reductase activating protein